MAYEAKQKKRSLRSLEEPEFGQFVGNAAIYGERFQWRLEKILSCKADLDSDLYRHSLPRTMLKNKCATIAKLIFQLFGDEIKEELQNP